MMELERVFLKPQALEKLITADKFILADEVNDGHLLSLKHNGVFLLKVPAETNESNPYDGFWWSKTTLGAKRKVLHRHQSIWKPMEIFGEKTHSIQSTEMYQNFLRKQCVSFNGYVHIFYFLSNDDELLKLPDEQGHKKPKQRISKKVADMMRKVVLPHRSVTDSATVGKEMGFPITQKQVANLARNTKDCLIGNQGPRAKTTLLMAENLKQRYPEQLWFEKDNNDVLTSLTFMHIYEEACQLFSLACPTEAELVDWTTLVDSLQLMSTVERREKIEALLVDTPDGVFVPSRFHVDTTFNVGDVYLTVVLGEVRHFRTISSDKARVIPLGYMLHSSKSKCYHEQFADLLKKALSKCDTASPRRVPCVLADGEEALECYAKSLNAPLIRCDIHILSLLRFDYGGKTALKVAKPFLFGRKVDGKWKGGLFAVFTMKHFEKRLAQLEGHIDTKIHDWLQQNSDMLMESISNYAKMRGGHLLQYSTNNANETFNSIIKSKIKKRYNASELILQINSLIEDKIDECWLAVSGCSEKVKLSEDIKKWSYDQKLNHFKNIGIPGARLHLMDIPPAIMKRFDRNRIVAEEQKIDMLVLSHKTDHDFQLKDSSYTARDKRYVTVGYDDDGFFACFTCPDGMPHALCNHFLFCVLQMPSSERQKMWKCYLKPQAKNNFALGCGSKKSDRIGSKPSARNHVRSLKEISSMSFWDDTSDDSKDATSGLSSLFSVTPGATTSSRNLTFSPVYTSTPEESERRSSRARRSKRKRPGLH